MRKRRHRLLNESLHLFPLHTVSEVHLGIPEKHGTGEGKDRDDQHPGQLRRVVDLTAKEIDHHDDGKDEGDAHKDVDELKQPHKDRNIQKDLQQEQQRNNQKPAENQPQQSFSSRFCKAKNGVIGHGIVLLYQPDHSKCTIFPVISQSSPCMMIAIAIFYNPSYKEIYGN